MSSSYHLSQKQSSLVASIGSEGREVIVVSLKSKKQMHKITLAKTEPDSKFTSVCFSYRDTFLVAATSAGDLHVLSLKPGRVDIKKKIHSAAVLSVTSSKTKDVVYSTGQDGLVKSYDLITQKFGLNKKDSIAKAIGKNATPLTVDVNGRDTMLLLSAKTKVLLYSLTENKFIRVLEGHTHSLKFAKFMDYSHEQRKDLESIDTEFFMSLAEEENICNVWKISSDDSASSPFKVLELTEDKVQAIQLRQIAEHYYFAICVTSHYVYGYILNLKSRDAEKLRKFDFKAALNEESINSNNLIASAHIKNEYELSVFRSNGETIDTHYITYLNDDGKSTGTDITIKWEQKLLKTNHYSINSEQHHNISKGVLEGIDISTLHLRVDKLFKGNCAARDESSISVLEQGLQENNVETINSVLLITDIETINSTIAGLTKDTLHQLMFNLLVNLQQKSNKAAMLWLSSVLKSRWIDVLKQVNKASIHSKHTLAPLYSHFKNKTANMSKYFEAKAKIQMVLESRNQNDNMDLEEQKHEESNPGPDELAQTADFAQNNEESCDEVVEDIEQNNFGNDVEEAEGDDDDEGDSEDSDKYRAELNQYGDDVQDESDDDASMDEDDDLED